MKNTKYSGRLWRMMSRSLLALVLLPLSALGEITFPDSTYTNLDYGLYWFGYSQAQKAQPGQSNPYYSNNKPTVIYIHGWQNGSVQNKSRETLDRRGSGGPNQDLAHHWLDRGWNVGVLYWNQFADESEVKDAEAKIHVANGPRSMRWKSLNNGYQSGPGQSVTDLLYAAIHDNMQNFSNSHFRLAGHSLGNQLALSIGVRLKDAVNQGSLNANLRPDRIALLDPFYSNGSKSYLNGQWTGEKSQRIRQLTDSQRCQNRGLSLLSCHRYPIRRRCQYGTDGRDSLR